MSYSLEYYKLLDSKGAGFEIAYLNRQLEQAQEDRKKYGVHLAAALKGEKRKDEPQDWRLDRVREIVASLEERA